MKDSSTIECLDFQDDGHARVERYRLPNGLELILWEDHVAPVVSFQTWFRVGSRHDPEGRSGIAHLFEHMMFKATTTRAEGEYDRIMELHGAQTNAATWVDWTYYKAKLPKWDLELAFELESDRMQNLALSSDMLEREREVVKNERLMRVDNDPEGLLAERLYRTAFTTHPYGVPTIGWMEDIERISLDDCMQFYRTHYAPNNATLVIVGDFDTQTALALAERYYGQIPAQALAPEHLPAEPPQDGPRRLELSLPLTSPRLTKAWKATASGSREHAALDIACELLVGSDSSRLHRRLVEELELATDVSGWVSSWAHPGLLEISLTLRPDVDIATAEAALDTEIAAFLASPPPERELEKARNGLEASFLRGLADVGSRARQLGHHRVTVGEWRDLWRETDRLRTATADDVLAIARAVLRDDRLTTGIGLPNGELPEVTEDLEDHIGPSDEAPEDEALDVTSHAQEPTHG